jgi:hypothetical protein
MSQAITADAVPAPRAVSEPLPLGDKVIIGFLLFCMLIAPLEAYWIIFRATVHERTDLFARLLSIYWPVDRTYRDPMLDNAQAFTLSVESVNVFVTQWLNVILIWAIARRKYWRHALQIVTATYTGYGTFLYFYVAHLSGYTIMENRTTGGFLLFYLANLPWLIGCVYMIWHSVAAINRKFKLAG